MRLIQTFACASFLFSVIQATTIIDSVVASQCVYYLKSLDWGCNSTSNSATAYNCRCRNINWLGSVSNCIYDEAKNEADIIHGYKHIRLRCLVKAHLDIPVDVIEYYQQNATSYLEEATDADKKNLVNHPVSVNQTQFAYSKESFNHIYAQVIRSQGYQWGFIFYWTFVIFVATICNFAKTFIFKFINSNKSRFTSTFNNKLRYYLSVSNLFPHSRSRVAYLKWWPIQLPNRFETVVISFYVIYQVLASCTGYTIELPNIYQNSHFYQLMDLIGYRTGLNSFALIPPTFFFGIRNNPFIPLTGLSIATFMQFHKWCAYGVAVQAIIHSAVWTHYVIREGDYSTWAMDAYWQFGIAGTVILCLMVFFASLVFREVCYEVFLVFHKLFGIFLIVTMWYHCNGIGWLQWIYATIVIWGYDRIMRFLLILWNGGVKTAKISKIGQGMIRVIVPRPQKHNKNYFAGSFTYFYFLTGARFYQSHPFSMMKSKRRGEEHCYSFVFKAHRGITKKLAEMMAKTEKESKLINILQEGPYGHRVPLNTHEQYCFISAGIGFTPSYSQAVEIIEHNQEKRTGFKQHIRFAWVVRSIDYFGIFYQDMVYLITNDVLLDVYITNGDEERLNEYFKSFPLLTKANVKFHLMQNTRPSLDDVVKETDLQYSTTFISSGPGEFTDQSRTAVADLIKVSKVRIDYFTE